MTTPLHSSTEISMFPLPLILTEAERRALSEIAGEDEPEVSVMSLLRKAYEIENSAQGRNASDRQ